MSDSNVKKISLGISPCPNDTFIFHALLSGLVKPDYPEKIVFDTRLADVEKLNGLALDGSLELTKISLGAAALVAGKYALLSSGSALGWGCGPLVVAGRQMPENELEEASIAIPGRMTTASLLLDLHGGFKGKRVEMVFSSVMEAVASGAVDLGVIIHEGRFTFQKYGLCKILDLGQWWEERQGMPLPLGAIAVRRDVPRCLALALEKAIAQSLEFAWKNPLASKNFIKSNAQELSEEVTGAHIATFVTPYSRDLGDAGKAAIRMLVDRACALSGKNLDKELFLS